jgi:hypothetical protein
MTGYAHDRSAAVMGPSAPTMLKALLRERNLHSYKMFKRAYEKSAKKLDSSLTTSYPSDRTFKRWVSGRIKELPRAEHCAVLEAMFPEWFASELFQPYTASDDDQDTTLLKKLLRQRYLQTYRAFRQAYDDVARRVNSTLVGTYPTERQYYRWVSGDMIGLPYPDHCSVLEAMFHGYTAQQLFEPYEPAADKLAGAEHRQQEQQMVTLSIPAEADINSAVPLVSSPSSVDEVGQKSGCGINRRHVLIALSTGVALSPLTQQAGGLRELVLNAAHSSAVLHSAVDTPKIEDRTLDEARQDLNRLATDYVVNFSPRGILTELVILRDRLYVLLDRHGSRPGDARELHLLLGATCVLLASVSHDLAEPRAAMIQTRTALTFAEFAGHAGLVTWVHCTRAMIASWWGSANDVLHHVQRARATGPSGIGAIRLVGLETRALAQSGQHERAVELLHTAHDHRDTLSTAGSLRDLGEVFTFSTARQHYYNAATSAHMHDWKTVEREASTVISLYDTPATSQCWPVTMTLSQVYLAQARLSHSGPEGAWDALVPVFEIPDEQRIPQTAQALNRIRAQLRSTACANLPAARDLDEAIRNFRPAADTQERP